MFDAVVSDMKLSDGTATQFLLNMKARNPDMHLVVTSGGSVPEELESRASSVLAKPFSDQELVEALRAR